MKKLVLALAFLLIPSISSAILLDGFVGEKNLFPGSLGSTFVKQYDVNQFSLDADNSLGSPTATFTASRGASNPATYIDANGVVQVTTTSDEARWTQGYYDSSGFTSAPGLLIEGAGTNLLTYGIFSADTAGLATGWNIADDVTNAQTMSIVAETLTNIAGSQAQRWQHTFGDGSYSLYKQNLGVDTVAQNDVLTLSVWLKGTVTSITSLALSIREQDNAGVSGTTTSGSDIKASISSTEWRRFSYTVTAIDADVNRAELRILVFHPGSGSIDLQIAGAQLEKNPYATSFCPTTTAALTRNEEILEYPIASNRTAATETIVIKFRPNYANGVAGGDQFLIDSDTKSRNLRYTSGSNDFEIFPNETDTVGSTVADLVNDTWAANASITLGMSVQSTGDPNIAGYYNGVADGTNTNTDFTANAWGAAWQIGADNGTANNFFGIIESVAVFNKVLSASEHLEVYNILNQ